MNISTPKRQIWLFYVFSNAGYYYLGICLKMRLYKSFQNLFRLSLYLDSFKSYCKILILIIYKYSITLKVKKGKVKKKYFVYSNILHSKIHKKVKFGVWEMKCSQVIGKKWKKIPIKCILIYGLAFKSK